MSLRVILYFTISMVAIFCIMLVRGKSKRLDKKNIKRYQNANKLRKANGIKTTFISVNTYQKLFKVFSNFGLTSNLINTIHYKLLSISSYTVQEINVYATRYTLYYIFFPAAAMGLTVFLLSDVISGFLMAFLIKVIIDNTVREQLNKRHLVMLEDFVTLLSQIRQNFLIYYSPLEAIQRSVIPPSLVKQIGDIEKLLEHGEDMAELSLFLDTCTFRLMKTFAIVCYRCEDNGDSTTEKGTSNFSDALTGLMRECQQDIRKFSFIQRNFPPVVMTSLSSILFIPIFSFLMTRFVFPATAIILYGKYGYGARAIILVFIFLVYNYIIGINDSSTVGVLTKNRIIENLQRKSKRFQVLIRMFQPKKRAKVIKVQKQLNSALTNWSIEYLTAERIFYSVMYFIIIISILVVGQALGKSFELKSMLPVSMTVPQYSERVKENLRKLDDDVMHTKDMTEEELTEKVIKTLGVRPTDSTVRTEVSRIKNKQKNASKPIFTWYAYLAGIVFAFVGYNYPIQKLKRRARVLEEEIVDDCLQLQTLISVIMNTPIDTFETLEWMYRTSTVHKHLLLICSNEFFINPEKAIYKLIASCRNEEMKRIANNLLSTIEDSELSEAFSNLLIEKDHIMIQRQQMTQEKLEAKLKKAKKLATIPILPIILLLVLIPVGFLALNLFADIRALGLF